MPAPLWLGPISEPIRPFDRPELADPPATTEGLGLVPFVPMPHYDKGLNGDTYSQVIEHYGDRFNFIPLTDSQAVAVVDGVAEVLKSTQV